MNLIERLNNAAVGGCSCLTEPQEPQYHAEQCTYQMICEAAAELARLTAEAERLRADAGRYRWLRDWWFDETAPMTVNEAETPDELDAAIDAAIKEAGNG